MSEARNRRRYEERLGRAFVEAKEMVQPNRIHACACGWPMPVKLRLMGEGIDSAASAGHIDAATLYMVFDCPKCGAEVSSRPAREVAKGSAGGDA